MAGRGAGKTRAGAEWLTDQVLNKGKRRVALVGRTPGDVREVMIEGESGLRAVAPPGVEVDHESSKRRVRWPNGAIGVTYSSFQPDQLRGPNHDAAWCDETASWEDAYKGDGLDTTWNNLMLALRSKSTGDRNPCVVTTTPKPLKLIRQLVERDNTVVTRASTYDNLANLSGALAEQFKMYEGTRLGRQELHGELLVDVEGALWNLDLIEAGRVRTAPELGRVVVAIDPATTSGEDADETGIVVAGRQGEDYFVLADRSCWRASPDAWCRVAVAALEEFAGDRIIGEANNGGDMIELLLRQVAPDVAYRKVTATRGKRLRAEPIAALYEQGKVHHVGSLNDAPPLKQGLEDQLCTWTPDSGESPDRLDALVWALTELSTTRRGPRVRFYA